MEKWFKPVMESGYGNFYGSIYGNIYGIIYGSGYGSDYSKKGGSFQHTFCSVIECVLGTTLLYTTIVFSFSITNVVGYAWV